MLNHDDWQDLLSFVNVDCSSDSIVGTYTVGDAQQTKSHDDNNFSGWSSTNDDAASSSNSSSTTTRDASSFEAFLLFMLLALLIEVGKSAVDFVFFAVK